MPTSYTVKAGDTLGKIARQFYGSAGKFTLIVNANRIANPDRLRIGQMLTIPDAIPVAPPRRSPSTPGPPTRPIEVPVPTPPAAPRGGIVVSPSIDRINEQRLAQLHPLVAERGWELLRRCAQQGLPLLVTQGLRTWEEQDKLYAKGRTAPPIGRQHWVTKAKGGQSWHNFGLAFDVVVLDSLGKSNWDTRHPGWKVAGEVGRQVGLSWGGDWQGFKDLPHFEYRGGLDLATCRSLYATGQLDAVWAGLKAGGANV